MAKRWETSDTDDKCHRCQTTYERLIGPSDHYDGEDSFGERCPKCRYEIIFQDDKDHIVRWY